MKCFGYSGRSSELASAENRRHFPEASKIWVGPYELKAIFSLYAIAIMALKAQNFQNLLDGLLPGI